MSCLAQCIVVYCTLLHCTVVYCIVVYCSAVMRIVMCCATLTRAPSACRCLLFLSPGVPQVAQFLRVTPGSGLFYFDASFRPVPLAQQYIGVSERNFAARTLLMHEICFDKVGGSVHWKWKVSGLFVFCMCTVTGLKAANARDLLREGKGGCLELNAGRECRSKVD